MKVEDLFIAAVGLQPEERGRFLAAQCGGDDDLQQEVASLLRYDTRVPGIEDALAESARSILTREPLEGTMLCPWRVERELGRGGM